MSKTRDPWGAKKDTRPRDAWGTVVPDEPNPVTGRPRPNPKLHHANVFPPKPANVREAAPAASAPAAVPPKPAPAAPKAARKAPPAAVPVREHKHWPNRRCEACEAATATEAARTVIVTESAPARIVERI